MSCVVWNRWSQRFFFMMVSIILFFSIPFCNYNIHISCLQIHIILSLWYDITEGYDKWSTIKWNKTQQYYDQPNRLFTTDSYYFPFSFANSELKPLTFIRYTSVIQLKLRGWTWLDWERTSPGYLSMQSSQGLLADGFFMSRTDFQTALLHLKPDPNASCQTRSPRFTLPFASR